MYKVVIFQLDNFEFSPFSRNLFNVAPELQKKDCHVTLLTTGNAGMEALPPGVKGYVLSRWVPFWLKLPRHYLAIPEIILYILRHRPDAIIARGVSFSVPTIFARLFSGVGCLIITTLHVSARGVVASRMHRSWRAYKILTRCAINWSDYTVAVSSGVALDYINFTKLEPERIRVIYNPVVSPSIKHLALAPIEEPWLRKDRTYKTLVHVGRFAPEKDHETLLKAFSEIRKDRNVRLLLIGDGPLRYKINEMIENLGLKEAVKLLGRRDNPFAYMARADALVLSSSFEGLPGVLIQAMSVGCPVTSTDCESGADEILGDGQWGPLSPVGDSYLLAKSISHVLDYPLPPEVLIQRAQKFSAEENAEKLIQLIKCHEE